MECSVVNHYDDCVVCSSHDPVQLINLIRERGITLDQEVLRREEINGRRVLYCSSKDFPKQSEEEVMNAIDALLAIHEETL